MTGRRHASLLALAALTGGGVFAAATTDRPAATREADLAAIRERVADLEGRLEEIRRRKEGLVGDLVEADYELRLQEERVAEVASGLDAARVELEAVEQETGEVEQRLESVRRALARRTTGLYRLGGRGSARLLLSTRATGDLLPVVRALRYLVQRDAELRRSLSETELELRRQLTALSAQRQRVGELVAVERQRLAELRTIRRRRARLLAEVESTERSAAAEVADWSAREGRLGALLAELDRRDPLSGREISEFKGALDRPITGTIVRPFGPRRDPRYRTLVPHNGVQFSGLRDEAVRVVFPGRVRYADRLEGYGPTVVVEHAGRVFTLYAGMAEISVGRDELLSFGQSIGRTDGGLYFEVRVDNRPVDPASWIR